MLGNDPKEGWVAVDVLRCVVTPTRQTGADDAPTLWFAVDVTYRGVSGEEKTVSWDGFDLPPTGEDVEEDAGILARHVLALLEEDDVAAD